MHRAGSDLEVVWLLDYAAFLRPEALEGEEADGAAGVGVAVGAEQLRAEQPGFRSS